MTHLTTVSLMLATRLCEDDKMLWYHAGARISKLVRNAEKAKTPVMCVIGKKEADAGMAIVLNT